MEKVLRCIQCGKITQKNAGTNIWESTNKERLA